MDALWLSATCRVCLASDREMYRLANTALEETYERVTSGSLLVEGWPCCVCGVCLSALRRCRRFMDTAREANDALDRWIRNQNDTETKLMERPLFFFTQTPTRLFEITSQGIRESGIKHERDVTENKDSKIIHQQNKGASDDEGNIPMEDIKYEVKIESDNDKQISDNIESQNSQVLSYSEWNIPMKEMKYEVKIENDNDTQISDNIESHNSQGLSYSECINAYDGMIEIENGTQTLDDAKFDISMDSVRSETAPGAWKVERNQTLVEDISFQSLSSDEDTECTPPDVRSEAESAMECLFPEKSKEKYKRVYENFMTWKNEKNAKMFSETLILAYFNEIAKTKRPSTLWAIYSMLKCTLYIKNGIDLKNYGNLTAFLKRLSTGFKSKKSEILTGENIKQFLFEAPDDTYLALKVALILGVTGACRSIELYNITTKDIECHEDTAIITLHDTKTNIDRMFVIRGEFLNILKRYIKFRPVKTKSNRFFLKFTKGKCTKQVIGRHKIAKMPKEIATYLNLPNPECYTGHCFRRSSSTFLADPGANSTTLKRHAGWKSDEFAEGYIGISIENETEAINNNSETASHPLTSYQLSIPQPSTSKQ